MYPDIEPEKESDPEYEIDSILDAKVLYENGKHVTYYLIKWMGTWDNTWEPAKNVRCVH
jgi:hypothetical protein